MGPPGSLSRALDDGAAEARDEGAVAKEDDGAAEGAADAVWLVAEAFAVVVAASSPIGWVGLHPAPQVTTTIAAIENESLAAMFPPRPMTLRLFPFSRAMDVLLCIEHTVERGAYAWRRRLTACEAACRLMSLSNRRHIVAIFP